MKISKDKNAVSEVVGTILVLIITVILSTIIFVQLSQLPQPKDISYAEFNAYVELNATGGTVYIEHISGERLTEDQISIYVYVIDTPTIYKISDGLNKTEFVIGDTWQKFIANITVNSSVSVSIKDIQTETSIFSSTLQKSISPSINELLISFTSSQPNFVENNSITTFKIYALVQYSRGEIPTNATVIANLTSIGLGNQTLSYQNGSGIYVSNSLTTNATAGTYLFTITATHNSNIATNKVWVVIT